MQKWEYSGLHAIYVPNDDQLVEDINKRGLRVGNWWLK